MKGYKTLIFNAIMTVGMLITVWTGVDTSEDVATLSNGIDTFIQVGMIVWGIGNAWLRAITDSPVFKNNGN